MSELYSAREDMVRFSRRISLTTLFTASLDSFIQRQVPMNGFAFKNLHLCALHPVSTLAMESLTRFTWHFPRFVYRMSKGQDLSVDLTGCSPSWPPESSERWILSPAASIPGLTTHTDCSLLFVTPSNRCARTSAPHVRQSHNPRPHALHSVHLFLDWRHSSLLPCHDR